MKMSDPAFGIYKPALVEQLFDAGSLEKIERILKATSPDNILRFDLGLIAWKYAREQSNLAPDEHVYKQIEKIRGAAADLRDGLQPAAAEVAETIAIICSAIGADQVALINQVVDLLEKLATVMPDGGGAPKRGRPANTGRIILIEKLAAIYKERLGVFPEIKKTPLGDGPEKHEYHGEFFAIAEAVEKVAKRLSPQIWLSNNAIGAAIDRVFERMRRDRASFSP